MKKILLFLVLFTSSCSTTENFLPSLIPDFVENYFKPEVKPYSDLPSFTPDVKIQLIWEREVSGNIEENYSFLNFYKYNDDIFLPTTGKEVYIISSESGEVKNSIDVNLDIFSNIIVDENLIYFGSKQDTITAIDYSNKKLLWQRVMSSEVMSVSEINESVIYVRTNDSKVSAIDINTGKFLWINSQIPSELSIRGMSEPVIADGKLFVGFDDGKIISYNLDNGDINWQVKIPAPKNENIIERLNDIDGSMIIDNSILYAISYQGSVVAIDCFTGQILWIKEASSIFGLDSNEDNVFYIDDDGILWGIEKFSGRPAWKQDQFFKRLKGTPIFYNEFVIAKDVENYLHIFNSNDGTVIGRLEVNSDIQFILADYDSLYMLDKKFSLKKYEINNIVSE